MAFGGGTSKGFALILDLPVFLHQLLLLLRGQRVILVEKGLVQGYRIQLVNPSL
jgi:hypothetical protein